MLKQLVILSAFFTCATAAIAAGSDFNPASPPAFTAACIKEGLGLSFSGRRITISPGSLWINDKLVNVDHEFILDVPPCPPVAVKNVPVEISSNPAGRPTCLVRLAQGRLSPGDKKAIDGVLSIGSLKVKQAAADVAGYKPATDFFFDNISGTVCRTGSGAIKEGQKVYVDCSYITRRLDTILVDDSGEIRLVTGKLSRSASIPPVPGANRVALANVYAEPGNEKLSLSDLMAVRYTEVPPLPLVLRRQNRAALAKTINKLESGQPVTIIFWGDSITAGADAGTPERSFAALVVEALRKRYPRTELTIGNAGVGGSNTNMRLGHLNQDVLNARPDLIIVEFINDLTIKKQDYEHNLTAFLDRARQAGSEVLLINPSLPSPGLLGLADWGTVAKLPYYRFIRQLSRAAAVGLADVEARWEHIDKEGLKAELLLSDGVIHPNDLGHKIYAEEILKCFQ